MDYNVIIYIIAAFCLIVGFVGSFLPVLPGPPISYIALLLLHFLTPVEFSTYQLVSWLIIVVIIQVLDYVVPMLGSKYLGGSPHGTRGCMAGTIVGMFFLPFGIIVGPFLGAVIGELIGGKDLSKALLSGLGSFLGFLSGLLLKLIVCIYFIIKFIQALYNLA